MTVRYAVVGTPEAGELRLVDGPTAHEYSGSHRPASAGAFLALYPANDLLTAAADATLLLDGEVLVTGGTSSPGFSDPAGAVHAAELWNPLTEHWSLPTIECITRPRSSCPMAGCVHDCAAQQWRGAVHRPGASAPLIARQERGGTGTPGSGAATVGAGEATVSTARTRPCLRPSII